MSGLYLIPASYDVNAEYAIRNGEEMCGFGDALCAVGGMVLK